MAGSIRLTKAEREYLRVVLDNTALPDRRAPHESILEKLEKSELVKGKGRGPTGLGYEAIIGALRAAVGDRLIPPMGGVIGMVTKRVQLLGLTISDIETIGREAALQWQGRIKAESIIRAAERLLADSRGGGPAPRTNEPRRPMGMDD